jgi:hypothetical protein
MNRRYDIYIHQSNVSLHEMKEVHQKCAGLYVMFSAWHSAKLRINGNSAETYAAREK